MSEFLIQGILGIVQGATEFIPVSSSAHLVLARAVFGVSQTASDLTVDALYQFASVMALIIFFRHDLWKLACTAYHIAFRRRVAEKEKTLLYALIIGTVPAVILGLFLESAMEHQFRGMLVVASTLIVGSVLMWCAERMARGNIELTVKKGFLVGLFQSLALVPGISRSGATISGGLILGLSREDATRFSFLLSFPILFGSGMKKIAELVLQKENAATAAIIDFWPVLFGATASFVVSYIAIRFLIRYVRTHSLSVFIWYRVALALVILIWFIR